MKILFIINPSLCFLLSKPKNSKNLKNKLNLPEKSVIQIRSRDFLGSSDGSGLPLLNRELDAIQKLTFSKIQFQLIIIPYLDIFKIWLKYFHLNFHLLEKWFWIWCILIIQFTEWISKLTYFLISIFNLPGIFHYFRRFLEMGKQFSWRYELLKIFTKIKDTDSFLVWNSLLCQTSIEKGGFEFLATKFLVSSSANILADAAKKIPKSPHFSWYPSSTKYNRIFEKSVKQLL